MPAGCAEYVYEIKGLHPAFVIKVYSSLRVKDQVNRSIGKDSVKFVIEVKGKEDTVHAGNLPRIYRNESRFNPDSFYKKVVDEIKMLMPYTKLEICKECGKGVLVPRYDVKKGRIWKGCTHFFNHGKTIAKAEKEMSIKDLLSDEFTVTGKIISVEASQLDSYSGGGSKNLVLRSEDGRVLAEWRQFWVNRDDEGDIQYWDFDTDDERFKGYILRVFND